MADIPSNLSYGTVTGRYLLAYADSNDVGSNPDAVPAQGTVYFTPSPNYIRDVAASPAPVTLLPASVECSLDANGYITGYTGDLGVRLLATDDADGSPVDWTWSVEFRLTDASGNAIRTIPSFSFSLPGGSTVDLTAATPVADSNGTYYLTAGPTGPQGPAGTNGTNGTNGIDGVGYDGVTSTTSLSIAAGSKAFTVNKIGAYAVGTRVRFASTATPTTYMEGIIATIVGLVITVTVDATSGSGTLAAWTASVAGNVGATGTLAGLSATAPVTYGGGVIAFDGANNNVTLRTPIFGYTTTATAAGTTTLTVASTIQQFFTGSTTQTIVLPVASTMTLGMRYEISNASTGIVTVNSSGGNAVIAIPANSSAIVTCILTSGTTAASWDAEFSGFNAITGTGSVVLATSPSLTTPALGVATATSINGTTIPSSATLLTSTSTTVPTAANATSASQFGFMGLPQVSTATGLSLTAAHAGKHIYTTATAQTHTIPANISVPLEIGTTIVFINPAAVSTSIAITTDTMYLAGTGTTGTRALAAYGMATAVKTTATTWMISGNGLS
jgi:hypothetical protein